MSTNACELFWINGRYVTPCLKICLPNLSHTVSIVCCGTLSRSLINASNSFINTPVYTVLCNNTPYLCAAVMTVESRPQRACGRSVLFAYHHILLRFVSNNLRCVFVGILMCCSAKRFTHIRSASNKYTATNAACSNTICVTRNINNWKRES